MARFYPTIDDDFHGSDGEIQVYQALQQLSDGYVVFHSFRWLGEPGQYRSEGEGDFIIFHPTKGILSIEVKSGGIGYEEGSWIQINRRNNSKKRINPLGQAAETQYRIQRILRQHFPYGLVHVGRHGFETASASRSRSGNHPGPAECSTSGRSPGQGLCLLERPPGPVLYTVEAAGIQSPHPDTHAVFPHCRNDFQQQPGNEDVLRPADEPAILYTPVLAGTADGGHLRARPARARLCWP